MGNDNKELLKCTNIHKSFADVEVLKGIDLTLEEGEVLAIIGGNGAGKSTLMKIFMGIYSKDQGELVINGEQIDVMVPAKALKSGVYLVPQEPLLFPNMTVRENIFLGLKGNNNKSEAYLVEILEQLEWDIDLDRQANSLSIAEQQLVEILRGLVRESKILILDEPTSSLTYNEIRSLFVLIEKLKKQGVGIIYITHRLNEVFEISDNVVILRDGKTTLKGPIADFTEMDLIKGLLPDDATITKYAAQRDEDFDDADTILKVENYSGNGFKDINLEIRRGEILGIAGVVGAGRTELAETIFGRDDVKSGKVYIENKEITGMVTSQIIDLGLNYVPEDRFKNGIFRISSIVDNITSSSLNAMKGPLVDKEVEKNNYDYFKDKFNIVCSGPEQEIGELSGGNQQKIVISRAVASAPRVLILDEPTRGVDAGAREDVYKIIELLKQTGVAVMVISSDMEELVQLADRVVSMYRGRINGEFVGEGINVDNLTSAIFGIVKESEAAI